MALARLCRPGRRRAAARHRPALVAWDPGEGHPGLQPEPARGGPAGGERHRGAGGVGDVGRHHRVVGAVDRPVVGALVGPDLGLGLGVGGQAGVPVEVVGGEVEPGAGLEVQGPGEAELEAGQLDHHRVGRVAVEHGVDQRQPDVAGGHRLDPRGGQHGRGQLGGGGLAVGAGHPDQRHGRDPGRQLDLAPDGHPGGKGALDERVGLGQAGATTRRARPSRSAGPAGPRWVLTPKAASSPVSRSGASSQATTSAPASARCRAAARPERPSPATSTGSPANHPGGQRAGQVAGGAVATTGASGCAGTRRRTAPARRPRPGRPGSRSARSR